MKKQLSLSLVFFVFMSNQILQLTADEETGPEGAEKSKAPIEVGDVDWSRDLDGACKVSKKSGKPVMILFQEVPGCGGCQQFGRKVLRHPLIVEASEGLFHPVVVYNNQKGADRDLLKRFCEPAWNYQVIRFLDSQAKDLIPRKDNISTVGGIATRMVQALKAAKRPVPKYLESLACQQQTEKRAIAVFAMPCFWSGEIALGGVEGVVATETGWLERHEVVLVTYHTDEVTLEELVKKALQVKCATKVFLQKEEQVAIAQEAGAKSVGTFTMKQYKTAKPNDQKQQITRSPIYKIPGLSPMQLTKINALYRADLDAALEWLSPRQKALYDKKSPQKQN